MKYLQFLFIVISISACSGTKGVVENIPNKTAEPSEAINDTIIKETANKIAESKETLVDSLNEQAKDKSQEFNQVLSKRFIETHELWDNLLKKHVDKNGNVDYKGFKSNSVELYKYFKVLNLSLPNETHSKEYKLAYWINAYNAMTIDLILRNYPIKSIRDIYKPWDQRYWKLGEKWYNLDEIEHRILRKMNEPRIHFAIVCASFSCPKLQNEAFNAENLEAQLTKTTKDFLSDSNRNTISENNLELSKIFQWFSKDFRQEGSLIDFLNKYSEITISDKAEKSYKDYNWDLNE